MIKVFRELSGDYITGAAERSAQTRGYAEIARQKGRDWGANIPQDPDYFTRKGGEEVWRTLQRGKELVKKNKSRKRAKFWSDTKKGHDEEIADKGFVSGGSSQNEGRTTGENPEATGVRVSKAVARGIETGDTTAINPARGNTTDRVKKIASKVGFKHAMKHAKGTDFQEPKIVSMNKGLESANEFMKGASEYMAAKNRVSSRRLRSIRGQDPLEDEMDNNSVVYEVKGVLSGASRGYRELSKKYKARLHSEYDAGEGQTPPSTGLVNMLSRLKRLGDAVPRSPQREKERGQQSNYIGKAIKAKVHGPPSAAFRKMKTWKNPRLHSDK